MNSNFLSFLILLTLYFIGSSVYCFLNKHRVGRKEEGEYGLETIEAQDVAFEASLWPGYLFMYIILFPYKLLVKLTELSCGQKKH